MKKSLLAGKGKASGEVAARRQYHSTVRKAEEKSGSMSTSEAKAYMKKIKEEAAKKYGLMVSFMQSGDKGKKIATGSYYQAYKKAQGGK
jgi:hypothetical protein